MDTLEKLFGSAARVKMMRLFLFNPDAAFDAPAVAVRTQSTRSETKRELTNFQKMDFVKPRTFFKEVGSKKNKSAARKKRVGGWGLNEEFPFIRELTALLVNTVPVKDGRIVRKLSRAGRLKLVIVAGAFIQNPDSRVDLLVVGDNLKRSALENVVKFIESEVGRELRYAAFETEDFKYRLSVYDKLVRDILDFPHERVLDRLSPATKQA